VDIRIYSKNLELNADAKATATKNSTGSNAT
jgi:hypothetical protein